MKKNWFLILICVFGFFAFAKAQTEQLARNYADQGEFEKAIISYKKALLKQKGNHVLITGLVKSYQQLEKYKEAESVLNENLAATRDKGFYYVEIGYNHQLQQRDSIAQDYYNQVIAGIESNTMSAYRAARAFQEHSLLTRAVQAYEIAMANNPRANYNVQLARLYGELGEVEKMFNAYLDLINKSENYLQAAQRNFALYVNDDPLNEANIIFRKTLLKRLQTEQNVLYNELLSWLFIQQKDYRKAFAQEKAIYRRTEGRHEGIVNLAEIAIEENAIEDATEILEFLRDNVVAGSVKLYAEQQLIQLAVKKAVTAEDEALVKTRFEALLDQYIKKEYTVPLQIDYAHFLAFNMEQPDEAIAYLKKGIEIPRDRFDHARLKMELADILVLTEKFNQALIYYSQIQNEIQNNVISQEARFKVAKTSYYKADFDWAESQLNVLKAGATQLIANDALELLLVIRNNSMDDSLQTALKKYATADLLAFQNKPEEAIALYDDILEKHKGEKIEDEALLSQAKLYERKEAFAKAEKNYLTIIEYYSDGVLADDAYYRLARLYEGPLNQPEKAKNNYERIIFDLADSIYYVEAQKRFRNLRGDAIN
ncbi:TolA-binding protein [Dokdonia sp. Hel_I_63]|uniref:tetratricopeptide repeat protein n=1 Tax=Dokdonia sp. Hel_I_63 TaxID=1249996 RepID=UPI001199F612|nr:tetratricopeptide repeat protein [Dokdonia sp. Hel_I_63]TVZ21800.1 TolA-binding protein [Dokdonia sp. Hel_I_63]